MSDLRFDGLLLTPGAGGRRTLRALVVIDEHLTGLGATVRRAEFPAQTAGRRRPDPPEVCIKMVRDATIELADERSVPTDRVAIGGRSFGGRMCSMAAAAGLRVAALVLVSYPLHPPGRPERLRTAHFPDIDVPCLFISGRRDPFGSPEELERETAAIAGDVALEFVDGDHSLSRKDREVAEIIAAWATVGER